VLPGASTTCAARHCHVYSKHYSAYAEVYQPDPPGLIHDDPRLLPPWRGSSLLTGKFCPRGSRGEVFWAASLCTDRALSPEVHRSSFGTSVT
jgi:hypothetical protein